MLRGFVHDGAEIAIHLVINGRLFRNFFFGSFFVRKSDAALPSIVVAGRFFRAATAGFFLRRDGPRKAAGLGRFGARHYFVFEFRQGAQEFTGFKRFDDEGVGAYALRFFRLEGLKFSYAEQHRNPRGFLRFLQALADFEAAVAGHVNVEDDEVGFQLRDLFECGRAIVDGNYLIPRIGEDFAPHVLGGHAVVG